MDYTNTKPHHRDKNSNKISIIHFSQPKHTPSAVYDALMGPGDSVFKNLTLRNTYQLPEDVRDFQTKDIRDIIESELTNTLRDEVYCPKRSPEVATALSEHIKQRVKKILTSRYRVLTSVFITSVQKTDLRVASKALLTYSTDTFESCSFSNFSLNAVAMVFVVYLE